MSAVSRLNQIELEKGVSDEASWHNDYKDTAWVKIRGLHQSLSEGDVLCVFSQFGEIEDFNLVRNPQGRIQVCLIKYEQFKSAVLTVDNFNDVELLGSRLSVDHHRELVRKPKGTTLSFEERLEKVQPGQAYLHQGASSTDNMGHSFIQGVDLFAEKKEKREKKKRHKKSTSSD